MDHSNVSRIRRGARMITQLAGLVTMSVLATGCSLLPFGHHGPSAKAIRAWQPQIHEVAPNAQPECIAEDNVLADAVAAPAKPARTAASAQDSRSNAPIVAPVAVDPSAAASVAKPVMLTTASAAVAAPAIALAQVLAAAPAERELQRLMDGNKRFVEGELENAVAVVASADTADGAKSSHAGVTFAGPRAAPAAMVLACADWEVTPDVAFDARSGELLVVRAPGNVADDAVIATARDAVQQYEIPLIVVVAHRACTAVAAPAERQGGPTPSDAEMAADAGEVRPAAHAVRAEVPAAPGVAVGSAAAGRDARAAARASVERLMTGDPALAARVAAGRLKIVAAYCDERNGQISLEIDEPAAAPSRPAPVVAPTVQPRQQMVELPRD